MDFFPLLWEIQAKFLMILVKYGGWTSLTSPLTPPCNLWCGSAGIGEDCDHLFFWMGEGRSHKESSGGAAQLWAVIYHCKYNKSSPTALALLRNQSPAHRAGSGHSSLMTTGLGRCGKAEKSLPLVQAKSLQAAVLNGMEWWALPCPGDLTHKMRIKLQMEMLIPLLPIPEASLGPAATAAPSWQFQHLHFKRGGKIEILLLIDWKHSSKIQIFFHIFEVSILAFKKYFISDLEEMLKLFPPLL